MSEDKKPERRNKYINQVKKIQDSAISISLENCEATELRYQQALSVLLRHDQLAREGKLHPSIISLEKKRVQINKCYEQRAKSK